MLSQGAVVSVTAKLWMKGQEKQGCQCGPGVTGLGQPELSSQRWVGVCQAERGGGIPESGERMKKGLEPGNKEARLVLSSRWRARGEGQCQEMGESGRD